MPCWIMARLSAACSEARPGIVGSGIQVLRVYLEVASSIDRSMGWDRAVLRRGGARWCGWLGIDWLEER